jgi:hypothetical protein
VTFNQVCNGILERMPDIHNNTDETDCLKNEWDCLTRYSECNKAWNCPDGHDELGCGRRTLSGSQCNSTTHFCLNVTTGYPICLFATQANDGIIDCVGSADER